MMIGMMASGRDVREFDDQRSGLAGHAVWRAVMPPPGLPRNAGCGSCGYELATLAHGRCSECGADLLKAGVTTRRNAVRTAGSLPAALLGWTAIVLTAGTVVMYAISIVTLTRTTMANGTNYTSNYTFRPQPRPGLTAPDFRLRVDVDVVGNFGAPATSGQITMELAGPDQTVSILFPDVTTDAWIITAEDASEIASGNDLRSGDILAAFTAAGLPPEQHPVVSEYADRIEDLGVAALNDPFSFETSVMMSATNLPPNAAQLVQSGGTSNFGPGAFNPFGVSSPMDYIVPLAILGLSFLIWAGGMFFIIRRRARLIEGPRDVVAPANIPPTPPPAIA